GSLREKSLVKIDNFKTPDAIDVKNSYGTLEFRRPDASKPWELFRDKDSGKGANVEETEMQALVSALTGKDQVKEFSDPKRKAEQGLHKKDADVTVTVYTDSLEKAEDKKADEKKDDKKDKKDEKKEEKKDDKKPGKPALKKDAKAVATLRFGNREK